MSQYQRNTSPALAEELDKPNPQISFLLAIEIPGQDDEGYTSFDRDLPYPAITDENGIIIVPALTYSSHGSVLPTRISTKSGGSDDAIDVTSGLDMVTRIKWENEYYIGAVVTLMMCKWSDPGAGVMILFSGKMGRAELAETSAKVEFNPWVSLLQRNILRVIGPVCDCPLYAQGRCAGNGEDPNAPQIIDLTKTASVVSVTDATQFWISGIGKPDGWASFGRLYFISGDNAGARARIVKKYLANGNVLMHNEFPHPVKVGDALKIEEGCEHTWNACKAKGNTNNFQAFPFLPGQQNVASRYSND